VSGIDTAEFRTLLEAERERLRHAVEYLHPENAGTMEDEAGDLGGHGVDNHLADMASATYDRELDHGLEETAQDTLVRIDAALGRLTAGTYGICELCGQPIGLERLRARPWAALCIDDQRRAG
jgi:RNA polymerase-binding transcription factor